MNLVGRFQRIVRHLRPPVGDADCEYLCRCRQLLALGCPELAVAPLPADLAAACLAYDARLVAAADGVAGHPVLGTPATARFRREHRTLVPPGAVPPAVPGSVSIPIPTVPGDQRPSAALVVPADIHARLSAPAAAALAAVTGDPDLYLMFTADPAGIALHSFSRWLAATGTVPGLCELPADFNLAGVRAAVSQAFGGWSAIVQQMREAVDRVRQH